MPTSFAEMKKFIYRRIKYSLRRPKPPATAIRFSGPVVIVGSAPVSHRPIGFNETYGVISVNASQTAIEGWGLDMPHVTLMGFNEIEGSNAAAVEARRVLAGRRTGALYLLAWRHGFPRLKKGLKAFNYDYKSLHVVDRYQRIALMHRVSGELNLELDADTKCSNGIVAVMFALWNGASAAIITGINPHSAGHAYNAANLTRQHVRMDSEMLARLVRQGYPIYTADPEVAADLGLPLWQGAAESRQR